MTVPVGGWILHVGFAFIEIKSDGRYQNGQGILSDNHCPILYHHDVIKVSSNESPQKICNASIIYAL